MTAPKTQEWQLGRVSEPDAMESDIEEDSQDKFVASVAEKILKRARVNKMALNLRTRLKLAHEKAKRGWQNLTLDEIESRHEAEVFGNHPDLHRKDSNSSPTPGFHLTTDAEMLQARSGLSDDTQSEFSSYSDIYTMEILGTFITGPGKDHKWLCDWPDCKKPFGPKENIESHIRDHFGPRDEYEESWQMHQKLWGVGFGRLHDKRLPSCRGHREAGALDRLMRMQWAQAGSGSGNELELGGKN